MWNLPRNQREETQSRVTLALILLVVALVVALAAALAAALAVTLAAQITRKAQEIREVRKDKIFGSIAKNLAILQNQ